MKKLRVVVVDDSAAIRGLISEIINAEGDMEAVGAAADPLAAREVIRQLDPDVITLDMNMPHMSGLEFLEKLMKLKPKPVVMVSALAQERFRDGERALELGAVELVGKHLMRGPEGLRQFAHEIASKIRSAAAAGVPRVAAPHVVPARARVEARAPVKAGRYAPETLIAIGASTGGTEAIKDVLARLPADAPGVVVAQHMPEGFTRSFAARLDGLCKIAVKEAAGGEPVLPGHAYIAPGHSHLVVRRTASGYVTELSQSAPVNRHRPSVDVLFRSVTEHAGRHAIAAILTGMGKDGAAGLLELRQAGAYTFAQDEASCVVFGMPKEAIALGGVDEVLPLDEIASGLLARAALAARA